LDIIQIDDVIPKLYQDQIEAEVGSDRFPWFFLQESARRREATQFEANYSGFTNTAFHVRDQMTAAPSPLTALLMPLLFTFCDRAKVPFNSLLRIRLGLFPRTLVDVPHHNPHVDFYAPHTNALYYVNDSDGDTFLFNETSEQVSLEQSLVYMREQKFTVGKRVSPKKGRMICFDGKYYHASMHPMQHPSRIAIAFSFT
jgi:hypothetical protein